MVTIRLGPATGARKGRTVAPAGLSNPVARRMRSQIEHAFLQDILEHPDDDAPRLIYADWLEEHGKEADRLRAEFIRVQVELDRLDSPTHPFDRAGVRPITDTPEWTDYWRRARRAGRTVGLRHRRASVSPRAVRNIAIRSAA